MESFLKEDPGNRFLQPQYRLKAYSKNLYYYFTVGKARIRSACNFVIMVIVADHNLFKDSNHGFLMCPIIVSIKVTSLMNIHPFSNPCHCARRIKTNRSASRGGQKLVPTTFYSRSTYSCIPATDNRANSWTDFRPIHFTDYHRFKPISHDYDEN